MLLSTAAVVCSDYCTCTQSDLGIVLRSCAGTQQGIDRINHLRVDELLHEDETTADLGKLSVKDMFARAASKADMYNQYSIPFGLVELRKAIADYTHTFYGFTPDVDNGITVGMRLSTSEQKKNSFPSSYFCFLDGRMRVTCADRSRELCC
eukprot:SAG31_NODE_292_length_18283_cov_10.859859_8_plen_151_part_00